MVDHLNISHCPICSGIAAPLGIRLSFHIAALNEKVQIDFACCNSCTFVFQSNPLTRRDLEKYYRESPRYRSADVDALEDGLRRHQVAFIERDGPLQRKSALDVGADMGKLLDLLRERGCATAYMEDSEAACRHLRSHGRHREIVNPSGERFDLLVLSQVFEHIVDPIGYMRMMRELLAPDGRVFIEVPCHSLWDGREYGFSFEHVNYFSPSTLSLVLRSSGFGVTMLEICTDPRYFDGKVKIIRALAQVAPAGVVNNLAEAVKSHYWREFGGRFEAARKLADRHRRNGKPGLALYGAAELADLLLSNTGLGGNDIVTIFDSDTKKHGTIFRGLSVRSPREIPAMSVGAILILSGAAAAIRDTIGRVGFSGPVVGWSDLTDHQSEQLAIPKLP